MATLDSSTELVSIALNYLGLPHNSQNPEDYQKAQELLLKVRPYIRYFDSSRVDTDLSNGNVCVVVGWQGTAYMAQVNNEQAGNGRHIAYSIPGKARWSGPRTWCCSGCTASAAGLCADRLPAASGGHRQDLQLRGLSEWQPGGAAAGGAEAAENPAVYLSKETMATLFPLETLPLKVERIRTRVWSRVKTGS